MGFGVGRLPGTSAADITALWTTEGGAVTPANVPGGELLVSSDAESPADVEVAWAADETLMAVEVYGDQPLADDAGVLLAEALIPVAITNVSAAATGTFLIATPVAAPAEADEPTGATAATVAAPAAPTAVAVPTGSLASADDPGLGLPISSLVPADSSSPAAPAAPAAPVASAPTPPPADAPTGTGTDAGVDITASRAGPTTMVAGATAAGATLPPGCPVISTLTATNASAAGIDLSTANWQSVGAATTMPDGMAVQGISCVGTIDGATVTLTVTDLGSQPEATTIASATTAIGGTLVADTFVAGYPLLRLSPGQNLPVSHAALWFSDGFAITVVVAGAATNPSSTRRSSSPPSTTCSPPPPPAYRRSDAITTGGLTPPSHRRPHAVCAWGRNVRTWHSCSASTMCR